MKIGDFEDSVFYRVACDCGSEKCDLTLELEYTGHIYLNMYKTLRAAAYFGKTWKYFDWFRVFKNKLLMMWSIFRTNEIEVSESFVIGDEDQIDSFIEVLEAGKKYLHENALSEK